MQRTVKQESCDRDGNPALIFFFLALTFFPGLLTAALMKMTDLLSRLFNFKISISLYVPRYISELTRLKLTVP